LRRRGYQHQRQSPADGEHGASIMCPVGSHLQRLGPLQRLAQPPPSARGHPVVVAAAAALLLAQQRAQPLGVHCFLRATTRGTRWLLMHAARFLLRERGWDKRETAGQVEASSLGPRPSPWSARAQHTRPSHALPTCSHSMAAHIIGAPWVSTPATVTGRWRARRLNHVPCWLAPAAARASCHGASPAPTIACPTTAAQGRI
jgi:hypothetical protein